MATARQIAANRRNAQKCTGPKSDEGKRVSRMNALQHGMAAKIIVLPYESTLEYHEMRAKLIEGYAPANNQEIMLVDQIAAGYWRTMRARAHESAMINVHVDTLKRLNNVSPHPDPAKDDTAGAIVLATEPEQTFNNYFRYDASIERQYYRAINTLEKLQARRVREERWKALDSKYIKPWDVEPEPEAFAAAAGAAMAPEAFASAAGAAAAPAASSLECPETGLVSFGDTNKKTSASTPGPVSCGRPKLSLTLYRSRSTLL
jgi:hypothetical protein